MENDKKKLLIIQPHSDDALFSCSSLIFNPDYQVEILTIENNPKRIKEDEQLYSLLGIPYHHLDADFQDESFYGYHKKYKDVTLDDTYEWLLEYFGKDTLREIEYQLGEFLDKFYKDKEHKGTIIVAPWGVGHPFHLFIRDLLDKRVSLMMYYREFPHSYKKRAKPQVQRQSEEFKMIYSLPTEELADVKWGLARKYYKSQSGLLWFEQGYIKKNLPEEIYIRQEQELPF